MRAKRRTHLIHAACGIDHSNALGKLPRSAQIASPDSVEKSLLLLLEAIRAAYARHSRAGDFWGQVEVKGDGRLKGLLHPLFEDFQFIEAHAPPPSLVGKGRVGKAVTHDELARRKGGKDDRLEMLPACCKHEQRLGLWHYLLRRIEQELAQPLSQRGAARLASHANCSARL